MPELIISNQTDVYFNLALEDYLLHECEGDYLILWQSENAVVCGKHQNICAEVNYQFCKDSGIQLARRLSGGGTVFHDLGNINFSFVQNLKHGLAKAIDYKKFLEPIRLALGEIGISTSYSPRNDLLCNEKKISGNAQHIDQKRKRVLHHGTLLIDSNLDNLGDALHSAGVFLGHSVKSVRSQVTTLKKEYPSTLQVEDYLNSLKQYFLHKESYTELILDTTIIKSVDIIRNNKFSKFDWIVGYSPKYSAEKTIEVNGENCVLKFAIENQIIQSIEILNDNGAIVFKDIMLNYFNQKLTEELSVEFNNDIELQQPYILL